MSSKNRQYLFVYGTLLRGQSNAKMMISAQFVRSCDTEPLYRLVDLGAWPGLVSGGSDAVTGEVYCVSDSLLEALDAFEEVPEVYTRQSVCLEAGSTAEAYFLHDHLAARKTRIQPANWASYCKIGDFGYRGCEDRS